MSAEDAPEVGPEPRAFILRGAVGGLALGGVAWLAVYRALGGRLDLNSASLEGWQAGAVLVTAGIVAGLVVAAAAFVMIKFLARAQSK